MFYKQLSNSYGPISPKSLCKIFTEILPRSRHDVWEILNLSVITARKPRSCRDLTTMFVIFWISVRFPPSRWDCWDLAMILSSSWRDFLQLAEIGEIFAVKFDSFCISLRSHCKILLILKDKLLTEIVNILPRSRQNCQHLTQSFPDGMNNFLCWIKLLCSSLRPLDVATWSGFI